MLVLFVASGFIYFSVICFYQFLFLRNLSSNNLGVDIIIRYLPSILIGAFGFVIKKGTFSREDKHEKHWLKLGELLNITDYEQLDNAKQEKLKKLHSIFGALYYLRTISAQGNHNSPQQPPPQQPKQQQQQPHKQWPQQQPTSQTVTVRKNSGVI